MKKALNVFKIVFAIIRIPVYLILLWTRLPVVLICNAISFPFMLVWLFSLNAFPDKKEMVWGFAAISFGAFIISLLYDWALMLAAPHDIEITR